MIRLGKFLKKVTCGIIATATLTTAANAAGTAVGTAITATFDLDYTVSSVAQSDPTANSSTFNIDRKVDLTVSAANASVDVTPNLADQVMKFTLTNNGNGTQGYLLTLVTVDGSSILNATPTIHLDDGVDTNTYNSGDDTDYTGGTNVGDLAPDAVHTLWVKATINDVANGTTANIKLIAQTTDSGTTTVTTSDSGSAFAATTEQTVFADADGDGGGADDAVVDGKHADDQDFIVSTADFTASQTAFTILYDYDATSSLDCTTYASAPVTNAKAIPGACIEIEYTLQNDGDSTATAVDWVVNLPTEITYEGYNAAADIAACDDTDGSGTGGAAAGTGFSQTSQSVTCEIFSIAGSGANVTLTFRISVD